MPGSAKRAKAARRGRSKIARTFTALENGQIGVRVVLETPPAHLGRIRVYDVLRRFPHLGRGGAETVCRRARVWPLTTMDNLTPEERQRLWLSLPPRAKS